MHKCPKFNKCPKTGSGRLRMLLLVIYPFFIFKFFSLQCHMCIYFIQNDCKQRFCRCNQWRTTQHTYRHARYVLVVDVLPCPRQMIRWRRCVGPVGSHTESCQHPGHCLATRWLHLKHQQEARPLQQASRK